MKTANVLQNYNDGAAASRANKSKWRELFLRRMRRRIRKIGDKDWEYCEER